MKRTHIDFGIDLGTTNSALSKIEAGEAKIVKSGEQKDTTPSAVAFNKKGGVLVGTPGYSAYRQESQKSLRGNSATNSFIEFKRTMGTDEVYISTFTNTSLSSEQLSSEVLKTLKSYSLDENITSAVITVPAAYTMNQIDAVKRAAKLAGLESIETLQEPVAAAMAYGLTASKDGYWLVFDFGGGTFDAAIIKVEEGIVKVIDTEGDNHLGGKDLDYAIVDNIILPHIAQEYSIDDLLNDSSLRKAYKFYAEEIKNELSFKDSFELYVEEGDAGEDDDGEEIEIDLVVSRYDLAEAIAPVFQKAIDMSLTLLERNHLSGDKLDSLVLVGGPTLSPILREMLAEQICTPDTSVDPMTVVANGAAVYASTIPLSDEIIDANRDKTKIQLQVDFEPSTVEPEEFVTIKVLENKTEGSLPAEIYAQITRGDGAWKSEKVSIDSVGEVFDVQLQEGKTNNFQVELFDNTGNRLDCEPNQFNVIQGSVLGSMPLPHHFGIEILDRESGKLVFAPIKGLEKNKTLPATGVSNSLVTQKDIRPGMASDYIKISLYQGESNAAGTPAILNEHVYDAIIKGTDLPKLLPANSTVELTIEIDKGQNIHLTAYFPYLDHTSEIKVATDNVQSFNSQDILRDFEKAQTFLDDNSTSEELNQELQVAKRRFEANPNDTDTQYKARTEVREIMKSLNLQASENEWPKLEAELKREFERLKVANDDLGDAETQIAVNSIEMEMNSVIAKQDIKLGKKLLEEISSLFFQLTKIYQLMGCVKSFEHEFDSLGWSDVYEARSVLDDCHELINNNGSMQELHTMVARLFDLLPQSEKSSIDDSVLVG